MLHYGGYKQYGPAMCFQEGELPRSMQPVAVDLFCGAGGLSFGLKNEGIKIVAGIDIDPDCRHPFESNVRADFHKLDITTTSSAFVSSLFEENDVKILAGCAPCQPFSTYAYKRSEKDERWQLLRKFGSIIKDVKPEIVTVENVPRLLNHDVFGEFMGTLRDVGYSNPFVAVVNCFEYGVPQLRKRLVVLASRLGAIKLVDPVRSDSRLPSVRQFIYGMENIEAGSESASDPLHKASGLSSKNLDRIRHSRPGGTWRDWPEELQADCHTKQSGQTYSSVYGRMLWNEPGPTLTTQFNGFGNGRFGHPEQDRAISLREGALLQTFPKDYSFVPEGSPIMVSRVARMIGNAVPVKLGEAIGLSILNHLKGI